MALKKSLTELSNF